MKLKVNKMINVIEIRKSGSIHMIEVDDIEAIRDLIQYPLSIVGSAIKCGNKRELASAEIIIAKFNNEIEVVDQVKKPAKESDRRIELLSVAQECGLNHGRSWVCSGTNIDVNFLNPSWEGELICYVY